jgi:hypothetical protein
MKSDDHVSGRRGKASRFGLWTADPLAERAKSLVNASEIAATSSAIVLVERDEFPLFSSINPLHWNFFVTIAGVFIASSRLRTSGIERRRHDRLMAIASRRLNAWNPKHGLMAFEDCKSFFERSYDGFAKDASHNPDFNAADALGGWIVWNVLDHPPGTQEESRLVRSIGAMTVHSFFDWWTEPA